MALTLSASMRPRSGRKTSSSHAVATRGRSPRPSAPSASTPYRSVDWRGGVVLVLGAEGRGLRPRVAAACDDLVALPLRGRIDSLNVSATAAVLLYQILQQRLDACT